ncbi:MAG: protocatechuate 3,4-dioxygenase [Verrucomicrobiota bacterium]
MRKAISRRQAISRSIFTASVFTTPGLFAEQLETAQMVEGPFYPDQYPLDTDNDLLILNDSITPAVGVITHVSGQVFSKSGLAVENATVEIWQVDNNGIYFHSGDKRVAQRDQNFQSYGRFLTDSQGRYYFRTIPPGPYVMGRGARAPHIHFGVSLRGKRIFTTQLHIKGHPDNSEDFLLRRIKDPKARETVQAEFKPVPDSKLGELAVHFDIWMGHTVQEMDDGTLQGLGAEVSDELSSPDP